MSINTRRIFLVSGALGIAALQTGCVTQGLFEDRFYTEDVDSILISADKKKIVFMGKEHDYIFDAPAMIVQTLEADFRKHVRAYINSFYVDGNSGVIKGNFILSLNSNAPNEAKLSARAIGYSTEAGSNTTRYRGELIGLRYKAGKREPSMIPQRLNYTYQANVTESKSRGEIAARSLLTPVTLAVDGVVLIGAIPLYIITVIRISNTN
jgi:hypothetical protein